PTYQTYPPSLHDALPISEPFVLYLNFFEFVASLWKLEQLSLREIKMLFQYYIELFDGEDLQFVREYHAMGFRKPQRSYSCHRRRSEEHTSELQSRVDLVC